MSRSSKDRDDGHYWPCLGCGNKTPSPSGYCVPCRTTNCKGCGKSFTPRKMYVKKCSDCVKVRVDS